MIEVSARSSRTKIICANNARYLYVLTISLFIFSLLGCDPGGELALLDQPEVTAVASENSVDLQWTSIDGAQYYLVYQSETEEINKNKALAFQSTEPTFNINNLENNKTYYFAVTSIGNSGESQIKTIISSIPLTPPPLPPVPSPPQNIKVEPGSESVTISWNKIQEANEYNLYIARSPEITKDNIETLSGWMIQKNITSPFTQTGLINGVSHYLVLTSANDTGESPLSEELKVTPTKSLKISMGQNHTCSILIDRSLWCWGYNNMGQLGDGTFESKSIPVNIGKENSWRDVSAGPLHSCAITTDDDLWCWGNNTFKRLGNALADKINIPTALTSNNEKWASISVGLDITCGILKNENKNLKCWGKEESLPILIPTVITETEFDTWKAVYTNSIHHCAIRMDSSLWCWGENFVGQLGNGYYSDIAKPFQNFVSPAASSPLEWNTISLTGSPVDQKEAFSCGIKNDASLWCWGSNHYGQLGTPYILNSNENPTLASPDKDWLVVATGSKHTCAIKADNSLWCLGQSPHGQVGAVSYVGINALTQFNHDENWITLAANDENTCATKIDGSIWCTGRNNHGQLGSNSYGLANEPVAVITNVNHFSVSDHHTCVHRNQEDTWCWGSNSSRQVGDGSSFDRTVPVKIGIQSQFAIATTKHNSCTISQSRNIVCWGYFKYKQELISVVPKNLYMSQDRDNYRINHTWRSIELGDINHCALAADDTLWCLEDFFTIEDYITEYNLHTLRNKELEQIGTAANWKQLSLAANQACAINQENKLWCWGINEYGELGTSDEQNYRLPEEVKTDHFWQSISVGPTHTCGISLSDDLWCWGNNTSGQLGDGSLENKNFPTIVTSDIAWKNVQLSETRTCGVKTDNTLWCWGTSLPTSNAIDDTLLSKNTTPQRISEKTDWNEVGVGLRFICATNISKTLFCWGDNNNGEIGDGNAWSTDWNQVEFPISRVILK